MRQLDVDNLPDATFRQLRSLRELSLGKIEKRIREGICFHSNLVADVETARGFFVDEVADFFGGEARIRDCCRQCPANAVQLSRGNQTGEQEVWAGCYGWLPANYQSWDYVVEFRLINSNWYEIWQREHWQDNVDLQNLQNTLIAIRQKTDGDSNLEQLIVALETCMSNEMILETELVPGGNSDGTHWTIRSHCPACKFEVAEDITRCPECGKRGSPTRSMKKKVLGLRPFVRLTHLVGKETTVRLLRQIKTNDPETTAE